MPDDRRLSVNALQVLERRYLLRDDAGALIETPLQMFQRVAHAIAAAEARFGGDPAAREREFLAAMTSRQFLPNSPTLMNAGAPLGQLSACFVIPVPDSIAEIFESVRVMALIHQSGGGTGFNFSRLRPKGDVVRSTHGVASGPVSFMRVFDTATDVIKQGGKRRGANMGILRADHPDILDFIESKGAAGVLSNFNISVAVTDAFMDAVEHSNGYALINPRTGAEVRRLSARHVFDLIATSAWKSGDPGLVFVDAINRGNPTPSLGDLESTNPCGELPLLPYESCNLGSVNLATMARDGAFDYAALRRAVRLGVRFLDDVIEVNHYPVDAIAAITRANRKVGLGVMGFADALIALGVPYDSDRAIALASEIMGAVQEEGRAASAALARERGPFPNWRGSIHDVPGAPPLRNATVTSIAPTGTISIIAGCSSGIEPLFALSFIRSVMEGSRLMESNPAFQRVAGERGFSSPGLMSQVAHTGSIHDMPQVPEDVRRIFVTDFDIAPAWHVKMQAAFQRHCDNAVSKTINLPASATVADVRDTLLLAYRLQCKGITVFRNGSKGEQVLYRGSDLPDATDHGDFVVASPEYAGGCPDPAVCEF
ncbi:MAG: adenosylcobalamin-dependent ribonucleoside-diphosphate reductase [Dehalococcoidia bacterium]|nr:adenosylcobalamin-dependent ribonucleoside-diphosphate reductase [Dehalococcoidia bacterium]